MLDQPASWSRPLDRGPLKRFTAVFILFTVFVWTRTAQAATVSILLPSNPSADMSEALHLLRGELLSVGLTVAMDPRPADHDQAGADSRRWLEGLVARGVSAVVDTVEVETGLAVDVWVVKSEPLRFEVTRAAVEPDTPKAPEVLALRAVEALRAGLLLVDRAARKQQQEPVAQPPPAPAPDPMVEPEGRWGLEAGAVGLASLDGVGLAILPTVRVGWAARSSLLLQAALAGAGTRPSLTTSGGSVRVAQQYGVLGARYRFRPRQRLWPFVAFAAGAMHTSVEGRSDALTEGHTVDQWSFLLEGGLGVGLRLTRRTYVALAAHVHWAQPYVVVHMVDAVGATTGRPNLAVTLTLGAWL